MGAILDIIGSIAIRAVIVTLIITLILTLRDAEYERTSIASTGENLSVGSRVMERDLKCAGYNVNDTSNVFLIADSQQVKFLGDINNDGTLDIVHYQIGADPSGVVNSKVIARTLNAGFPLYIAKGPVSMKITYYDSLGNAMNSPITLSKILSVSVLLSMKNNYPMNDTLSVTIKREIIVFPANLQ